MDDIAAGKGRAPKPFMLDTRKLARADAIWNSQETQEKTAAAGVAAKVPDFIEPELAKLVERPPDGDVWAQEA
jgi:bifunctional non-homologous end joining protein LigD